MQYWLVKTEPEAFSWQDLVAQKRAVWDGVRNYTARNNLKAMALNDIVLIYHSVTDKCVVGFGRVDALAYPDPTTDDERWVAVDIVPVAELPKPVTLAQIKAEPALADLPLIKQSRLSVMPVSEDAFKCILEMGKG
jgi:predicted RNA-binding protein with PUA-like domain